ncbi:DUF6471 domain-containing protein [Moraxella canis]|uniref:DUF6471 domain-containing protein n=1 Tax=Moraxella canis TaxID=90239 RepID=A0A1S9ZN40_9GAMM|nr:DUF6471 domain-containing protein [Moraxella canis]OOR84788.1 hypothetical protein B0180_02355 [Moraxella canis]
MNQSIQTEWRNKAKGIVKSEIALRNLSYHDVVEKLKELGIEETPQNLSNKISRGAFGADFMLQVLTAIGCENIRII